jgi:ATP-dependent Clp protease, protease subunit
MSIGIKMRGAAQAELIVFGPIGATLLEDGVTSRAVANQLKAMGSVNSIHVSINSPGGNAFEAIAIYNALVAHPARVVVDIYAAAFSAASFIAMAGDEIRIAENAFMMIHEPMISTTGTSDELANYSAILAKLTATLIDGYTKRTKLNAAAVTAMLKEETWFDAAEAVACGLADKISAPLAIAASFDLAGFKRVPAAVAARQDYVAQFNAKVSEFQGKGMSKSKAHLHVCSTFPELRQKYVEAHNQAARLAG